VSYQETDGKKKFLETCAELYDELDENEVSVLIDLLEAMRIGKSHIAMAEDEPGDS
jgi:hypothetical protein